MRLERKPPVLSLSLSTLCYVTTTHDDALCSQQSFAWVSERSTALSRTKSQRVPVLISPFRSQGTAAAGGRRR